MFKRDDSSCLLDKIKTLYPSLGYNLSLKPTLITYEYNKYPEYSREIYEIGKIIPPNTFRGMKERYVNKVLNMTRDYRFKYLCCNMRDFKLYFYDLKIKCKHCSFMNECTCFRVCQEKIESLINRISHHECINKYYSEHLDIEQNINKHKNEIMRAKNYLYEPQQIEYDEYRNIKREFYAITYDGHQGEIIKTYEKCNDCKKNNCDGSKPYEIRSENIRRVNAPSKGRHTGNKKCLKCFSN